MYHKVECICLTCDNCGETYTDEHSGFQLYVDENGAHEAADNDGWSLSNEDGKDYCRKCHKIDDEDNLVIDESRKVGIPQVDEYYGWIRVESDLPNDPNEDVLVTNGKDVWMGSYDASLRPNRRWGLVYPAPFETDEIIAWTFKPRIPDFSTPTTAKK